MSKKKVTHKVGSKAIAGVKKTAKPETKKTAGTKTFGNPTGAAVPSCIAELRTIAKSILALKNMPEKHEKAIQRLVDGCNKTADRIYNGLDSEEKKAEREAKKVAREKVKAEREAKKTAKKLEKIKKLREQLAALEAPAETPATDEK